MGKAEVGRLGEKFAEKHLCKLGFKILERNWKTPRWGEIDRIAKDGDTLVFVEVKSRVGKQMLKPWEAVGFRKIKALRRAAYYYCLSHENLPKALRIDVVSVELDTRGKLLNLEHFKNVGTG